MVKSIMAKLTIDLAVGVRSNFVTVATRSHAPRHADGHRTRIARACQHRGADKFDVIFWDFGLPEAGFQLGVGSGSRATQTAVFPESVTLPKVAVC
jgi:hypothetical protein